MLGWSLWSKCQSGGVWGNKLPGDGVLGWSLGSVNVSGVEFGVIKCPVMVC